MTDFRTLLLFMAPIVAPVVVLATAGTASADSHVAFLKPVRAVTLAAGEPGLVDVVRVRRGDAVTRGQVVLDLDTSVLAAGRAIAASEADDRAALDALVIKQRRAARRVGQYRALGSDGLGSDDELEQAIVDEQIAALELAAAREQQARRRLRVAEFDARIAARRVVCPLDGVVVAIDREPGEFITASQPDVAEVADLSQLRATFHVPTAAAVAARTGGAVTLRIPETGAVVAGRVEFIGPTTAADSGRVRLDVLVDNADRVVRSGLRCTLSDIDLAATASGVSR